MILYMYIAPSRGKQPPGDKVLMSTEMSCHHALLASFKKVLKPDFIHFFHDLVHAYSPGTGADSPWDKILNRTALSLCPFVTSFKEISLKSDFIFFVCFFFQI